MSQVPWVLSGDGASVSRLSASFCPLCRWCSQGFFFALVSNSSSVRGEGIAFLDDWLMPASSLEDS